MYGDRVQNSLNYKHIENTHIKPQGDHFADRCVDFPLTVQIIGILCNPVVKIGQNGSRHCRKDGRGTSTSRDVRNLVVCQISKQMSDNPTRMPNSTNKLKYEVVMKN